MIGVVEAAAAGWGMRIDGIVQPVVRDRTWKRKRKRKRKRQYLHDMY